MSIITLAHLTDLVALCLGEFPDCRIAPAAGSLQSSLAEMIEPPLPSIAREITLSAELSQFTEPKDFTLHAATTITITNNKVATITLPDDFCRLHSVQFDSWPHPLSEDRRGDPLRESLAESAPPWLAQRTLRPWLRLTLQTGTHILTCAPASAPPTTANYIPHPEYDPSTPPLLNFDAAHRPHQTQRRCQYQP